MLGNWRIALQELLEDNNLELSSYKSELQTGSVQISGILAIYSLYFSTPRLCSSIAATQLSRKVQIQSLEGLQGYRSQHTT